MLRKAATRACGTLASRLQKQGSLLENKGAGFQYRSFSTLPHGTRPCFAPSSANTIPHYDTPSRGSFTQFYLYMLGKYPILTKSVTAGTIMCFADATSQGIVWYRTKRPEAAQWNVKRLLLAAAGGAFIAGPIQHVWYNFAARVSPAQTLISTLKKMAMEQLILSPASVVALFSFNKVARGKSITEMMEDLEPLLPIMLKGDLMYWPAASFITYRHVPVPLQPLARSSFFFLWSVLFTYMWSSVNVTEAVH